MKIEEVGEFGLINKLSNLVKKTESYDSSLIKGIGDDAAVVNHGKDECELITTDVLVENIHFDLLTTPLSHLGVKIIESNVSDIYAMNAVPMHAVISVGIPNNVNVKMLEEVYQGIARACGFHRIAIVGGDTSASTAGLFFSVTIIGKQVHRKITYRTGALPGDILCVTGDLGRAYAGLKILMRERAEMIKHDVEKADLAYEPSLNSYKLAIEKHLMPRSRKDIITMFSEKGFVPTSMIDVSDGLVSEVLHLCNASRVGAVLNEICIPIMDDTKRVADFFLDDAINFAMNGGEDYELLFTIDKKNFHKIESEDEISFIGEILDPSNGIKMINIYNEDVDLTRPEMKKGYQHF